VITSKLSSVGAINDQARHYQYHYEYEYNYKFKLDAKIILVVVRLCRRKQSV